MDNFLIGPQNDEYDNDEFWFWSDFQDLGMGIPESELNQGLEN